MRKFRRCVSVIVLGASLLTFVGCSTGNNVYYFFTVDDVVGKWQLAGTGQVGELTVFPDGTLKAENWSTSVLCQDLRAGQEAAKLSEVEGIWVGGENSTGAITFSLDAPCNTSRTGFVFQSDERIEIRFYYKGADLDGDPTPELVMRRVEPRRL